MHDLVGSSLSSYPENSFKAAIFHNIHITRDVQPIINGLSLRVNRGALVSVLGANGAGKSTLFQALVGLHPYQGAWGWAADSFRGVQPTEQSAENRDIPATPVDAGRNHDLLPASGQSSCVPVARNRIAYLAQQFQGDRTFPLTVSQVVTMALQDKLSASCRQHAVDQALHDWGLEAKSNSPIQDLSGGQFQCMLLARLGLCEDADILLLDEPFAGLDEAMGQRLLQRLQLWARQGRIVFVSHHSRARALAHFPLTLLLAGGRGHLGPSSSILTPEAWAAAMDTHDPACC